MKNVSILVPEGSILGSIEGPYKLLNEVNDFLIGMGREPLFKTQLVGINRQTKLNNGIFIVNSDALVSEVSKTDLVIIPAVHGDPREALKINADFIPFIIKQHQNGAEIASLCLGAFLLASTGLLKGKKCATHWLAAAEFRKMFPDVELMPDEIITDENGIYSSGGAYSYLNLILYLVEKYAGRDIAIYCSKVFQIDIERKSQSTFIMFKGQKGHNDESIIKAQEFIENNFQDRITVDQLASMLAIGRRNLERRFKKATSNTVVEYAQRVKIEAAKKTLEMTRANVNDAMYTVGYTDPKAFRNTFKKITGLSPIEYRKKYNREAAYSKLAS